MKEKAVWLCLFLLGFAAFVKAQELIPIREAYQLPAGTHITIEGVINSPDYGYENGQFFVQNNTGGLRVFFTEVGGEMGAFASYDQGDTVRIQGRTDILGGALEVLPDFVDLIASGDSIPSPVKITPADLELNSVYQGMRVEIAGLTLSDKSQWPVSPITNGEAMDVEVTANGTSFLIRIDRGQSFFDGSTPPEEPFTLRGILSHSEEEVYILPFYESDISAETATNTFEALKLDNNLKVYPNPVKEEITLEVLPQAGTVDRVILTDLLGRTVAQYTGLNARNQILRLPVPARLRSGQYFLSVWTENGLRASKLMAIKK
ncbi:MAG TPA: T9SS type A sorting domain-containing protein [Saprospiraceae bacterium]|nr:T9SS type A sorting domain-containing protein [Saprospiraceae bacterium]